MTGLRLASWLPRRLGALALLLVVAHVVAEIVQYHTGRYSLVASTVDLVEEASIPNVFSALLFFITAVAAGLCAIRSGQRGQRLARSWWLVTALLLVLGFDEGAGLHDRLSFKVNDALNTRGILFVGWVAPYLAIVAAAGFCLLPMIRDLPRATRTRLILAGTLYLLAALGLEIVEGLLMETASTDGTLRGVDLEAINRTPAMIALVTIEEAGEMAGVILALRAILLHLAVELGLTRVDFVYEPPVEASAMPREGARSSALPASPY